MISKADLPNVRRLEAVGFRAWPAASVQYDGSWLVRLTAGHDSKRLNSVNPLDPSDYRDLEIRLEKAARRFAEYGRPLTVRQTPLAPPQLIAHMDANGWQEFSETIVMMADIPPNDTTEAIEHLPLRDVGRFVDARLQICGENSQGRAGLAEVINDAATGFELPLDHDRLYRWQSALFPGGTSGIRRIAVGRYRDHEDPSLGAKQGGCRSALPGIAMRQQRRAKPGGAG